MKINSIFFALVILAFSSILQAEERKNTFTEYQEHLLSQHPKVLSFLFHMTRNKLNFNEMAERYHLKSVQNYYNFLIQNHLMEETENGSFKFLFLDPYGVWALRTVEVDKESIYYQLRQQGVERLIDIIKDKQVNLKDDPAAAIWTVNTARLTEEQYQEYKKDLFAVCQKYSDLGGQNVTHQITNYETVWMMYLAGKVDHETAKTSHLLFGTVEEFE